ncbi:MAG: phosphate signaling complex protein PhoU [Thermogutta sp.]|nr:phosphate signaling complex protein PhoU [Thermogutta sp.]
MSIHMHREIDHLKTSLLELCGTVEEQLSDAVRAVLDRDPNLADQVERQDQAIDRKEIEIEEAALKLLALYQPVALDLRFVIAFIKINNDLERIGDLAVNIARKARTLSQCEPIRLPIDVDAMWRNVKAMIRDSVDSLVQTNAELAADVCRRDEIVDRQKRDFRIAIEKLIAARPEAVQPLLQYLAVSRNLERAADHATNIAEDVIYLVQGQIPRHQASGKE